MSLYFITPKKWKQSYDTSISIYIIIYQFCLAITKSVYCAVQLDAVFMKFSSFMFAVSIVFGSWTVGLLLNSVIKNKIWYTKISNLNFIKSETANKYLGILLTRTIIRKSFFGKFNPALKISKRPNREELLQLRKEMTSAEIGHHIAFISIIIIVMIFSAINSHIHLILPLLLLNIILNLYPSLLQQLNKRRLDKVLHKPAKDLQIKKAP